jgi:hypothetical protein
MHRSDSVSGPQLWPEGAVDHYVAVAPLIRQRHDATELAAVTMMGWGFPVDVSLLHKSYGKIYVAPKDQEALSDAMLARYRNRGMPLVKTAISHMRSHGFANDGSNAEDLGDRLFEGLTSFSLGMASLEQIRDLLGAVLPKFSEAPKAVIDFVIRMYEILQSELSLPRLLNVASKASVDELLAVLPQAKVDVEDDFNRFGGFAEACGFCEETKGLLIGVALPYHLLMQQLDFDSLLTRSLLEDLQAEL